MPRPITGSDIRHQDLPGTLIKEDDRLEEWTHTEELHRLNRLKAPATLPSVLEVISQNPGEAGILIAVDRLRDLYEAGVSVISTSDLLFGERILKHELHDWDRFIQPGQAACLTDFWWNTIRPRISLPGPIGTKDFYPSSMDWTKFVVDLTDKLNRVISRGSLVVIVSTEGVPHPDWINLVNGPAVKVETVDRRLDAVAIGRYIATRTVVRPYRGATAIYEGSPLGHSYRKLHLDPFELADSQYLTAVFDYSPEIEY